MKQGSNALGGFKSFFDLSLPLPEDPKIWFSDLNKVLEASPYPIYSKESICQQIAAYVISVETDKNDRKQIFQRMLSILKKFQLEFLWFKAIPQLFNIENKSLRLKLNNINLFYRGVLGFLSMQKDEELREQVKLMLKEYSLSFGNKLRLENLYLYTDENEILERATLDLPTQVALYSAYLEKSPKIFPELTQEAKALKQEMQETMKGVLQEIQSTLALIDQPDFKLPSLPKELIKKSSIALLIDSAEEGHFVMPRSALLRPIGSLTENLTLFQKPSLKGESRSKAIFPALIEKYNQLIHKCNLSVRDREKLILFNDAPKYSLPKTQLSEVLVGASLLAGMCFFVLALVFLHPVLFALTVTAAVAGLIFDGINFFKLPILKGHPKKLAPIFEDKEQSEETTSHLKQALMNNQDDMRNNKTLFHKQNVDIKLGERGFIGRRKSMPAGLTEEAGLYNKIK